MRRLVRLIAVAGVMIVGVVTSAPAGAATVNGAWTSLGTSTLNERIYVLAQEGTGTGTIYAGGFFTNAGGNASADYIASVDPSNTSANWQALTPTPLAAGSGFTGVYSIAPDAASNTVFIGGNFNTDDRTVEGIVSWDGNTSSNFAGLTGGGVDLSSGNDGVEDLVAINATTVYLSGGFRDAGGNANADNIALYSSGTWTAPGTVTTNNVNAIAYSNATTIAVGGPFFVGGAPSFGHVALWECNPAPACGTFNNYRSVKGDAATDLGFNPASTARTVAHLTYIGTELYAGGNFTTTNAATSVTVNGLAKWDGTAWAAVPAGGTGLNASGIIETMATSVGATTTTGYLYIGGSFTSINGVAATNVARMDLATGEWSSLGCGSRNGVNGAVRGILPQTDGSVIVGGHFTDAGGNSALDYVARYTPGADNCTPPPPDYRIEIDGNGGVCTPSLLQVEAVRVTDALSSVSCSFGSRVLGGLSTTPDFQFGTFIGLRSPGFLRTGNRYFAIWGPPLPRDVVATPGVNLVTVTWKPPTPDDGPPVQSYIVDMKSSTETNFRQVCRRTAAEENRCTLFLLATNLTYTFRVRTASTAQFESGTVETAAVSPYGLDNVVASRVDLFGGIGGTNVKATGLALGRAGTAVKAQYKVGSANGWTTDRNAIAVNADGKFRWSKKFGASDNGKIVTLRFAYGDDVLSREFVLNRGSGSQPLSAPRNIKVRNTVNSVSVTWDPPQFNGGEVVGSYRVCASGASYMCGYVSADSRSTQFGRILRPGEPYSIRVAAITNFRTGPEATAAQQVSVVQASVKIFGRDRSGIGVTVSGVGFKKNSPVSLEVAIALPTPPTTWRWERIEQFTVDRTFERDFFSLKLGESFAGKNIVVRLVTPDGIAESQVSRAR